MGQLSWNRQLVLAVSLLVLGTVAYWLEFKHKPQVEAIDEQSKHAFDIGKTSVQSISLMNGEKKFTLVCSDFSAKLCKPSDPSKWELTEPLKLKADDQNANSLLSTLNTLSASETIDLSDEVEKKKASLLKEYGLSEEDRKKGRRIEVITSAGKTTLYLGNNHPIGDTIFSIVEGTSRVYLLPNFFKANLDHDLTYWRDKKLLTLSAHEVYNFKFDGYKAQFAGERRDGHWVLQTKEGELPGDTEAIDGFLSGATFLAAKDFTSDDKKDAKARTSLKGFSPILTLSLQKEKDPKEKASPTSGTEEVVMTFFQKKKDPKTILPGSKLLVTLSNLDPLFELDPHAADRILKEVKDLRMSKLITMMDKFSAKRIQFVGQPLGKDPLVLKNKDGKWIDQADQSETSVEKTQTLLDALSSSKVKEFLTGSAIPSGEDEGLRLTLGDEKNEDHLKFAFWKKGDKCYGKDLLSKRNEAFLLDKQIQEALPWSVGFFKKAETKK